MTTFTAFLYVDTGTETTHLLAWDPDSRQWVVPCGNIDRPTPRQCHLRTLSPALPVLYQPPPVDHPHRSTKEEPMSDSTSDSPFV